MELEQIISFWNLPSDTRVLHRIDKGVLSVNYAIGTNNQRWFLKRYRYGAKEEAKIREVHQVKRHFAEHGIPVVMPLEGRNATTYLFTDGAWYALFPFIDARQIERTDLTPASLASAGLLLAKIHRISREDPLVVEDVAKDWGLADLERKAQEVLDVLASKPRAEWDDFDRKSDEIIRIKLDLARKNTLTFTDLGLAKDTLCHGDYQEANMFFNDRDEVAWLFDWEKTDMEPRVYEVLRAIDLMCINGNLEPASIAKAQIFLRAYHEDFPLTRDELAAGLKGRYIRGIHSIWTIRQHYITKDNRSDKFLETEYRNIYHLAEREAILEPALLSVIN